MHVISRFRAVRVLHARYAEGVLYLQMACAHGSSRPQPMQWVLIRAPAVSLFQWHPFSVATIDEEPGHGEWHARQTKFGLTIRVKPGGWTDALRASLAARASSSEVAADSPACARMALATAPTLNVAGWYGLVSVLAPNPMAKQEACVAKCASCLRRLRTKL